MIINQTHVFNRFSDTTQKEVSKLTCEFLDKPQFKLVGTKQTDEENS